MAGKMDWLAFALPVEKKDHGVTMVIERLQREFPIARPSEPVGGVRLRMEQAGLAICPVLDHDGVLVGALDHLNGKVDPATPVENVMNPGPATVRPSVSVGNAVKQLDKLKRRRTTGDLVRRQVTGSVSPAENIRGRPAAGLGSMKRGFHALAYIRCEAPARNKIPCNGIVGAAGCCCP